MASEEDREDRLRSWALTDLSYYGPEEASSVPPEWGIRGGMVTADGVSVELQGSVVYRRPDGSWIEVVSRRPADDVFVELMDRVATGLFMRHCQGEAEHDDPARRSDAERDGFGQPGVDRDIRWLEEVKSAQWVAVVIAVAGRPTIFGLKRIGQFWTAAGRVSDADLILTGRGETLPASLIPIAGPGPAHFRLPSTHAPRARRFPDELTAPVDLANIAEHARVDLTYRPGELSGTYATAPVRLALDVPTHRSSVTGSFSGADLTAAWDLADNSTAHPDVPGTLRGTFADLPVSVDATFHLDDDYWIEHAAINGDIAGHSITARLEAVDGGLDDSGGAVRIEGNFAGTSFALYTSITADMTIGIIRGHIAGEAIQLDTTTTRGPTQSVRLVGRYAGPPVLLAIIVCTFLYFV